MAGGGGSRYKGPIPTVRKKRSSAGGGGSRYKGLIPTVRKKRSSAGGGGSRYKGLIIPTVRKKRSQMLRRPRTKNLTFPEYHDHSPLTSLSDNVDRVSRNKNTDDANAGGGRICNLSYCICSYSSPERSKGDYSSTKSKEDGRSSGAYNNARGGDDTIPMHGASLKQLGNAGDDEADEFKLAKLKLKIAGAAPAHIIQTKNSSYGSSSSLLSSKSAQPSDASQPRQNLTPQENSSEDGSLADKKDGLKGISCEDLPGGTIGDSKSDWWEELHSVIKPGYPYYVPQRQKTTLSEVEQQLKNVKAAQKSEAEAITKILGPPSNMKKQQEVSAQEKVADELPQNAVSLVMGPPGYTATFSHHLPSTFDSKPCSYPPPREKCAVPSCLNTYKFRDSKTKLPVCSVPCYKAIKEKMQDEKTS